jgi:acyl-CoA thioesterase FadM
MRGSSRGIVSTVTIQDTRHMADIRENAAPTGLLADGRPFTRKRIAFRDCDAFGILYNTRFLDYIMDTRYDHLIDRYDMDFLRHHYAGGGMFVIVSHQASYFEPARAHEEVLISTSTIFADAGNMILEGAMTSLDGKRLKFHQWTRLKVLNPKTGAAAPITADEIADLRRTMSGENIADTEDYRGRVKTLLGSMRA